MCGIAGWLSSAPIESVAAQPALENMLAAIAHRGPDGSGINITSHAALGHVRLAIIDLEQGKQPLNSHDHRFSITFNGEIYNYRELRTQLESKGHIFNTHSDTEVIIELYRAEGWQGFNRLRGMYAFALWDNHTQRCTLVRDPLGIKPLFVQKEKQEISFASEAKAIIARDEYKTELNTGALHLLLNFRYLPGEYTLFQGIEQLAPGTVLIWQPGGTVKTQELSPYTSQYSSIPEALHDTVSAHFTSDVEVATYLSGGIDSAAVTAIGKHYSPQTLRTFTLKAGDDPNEARYAAETAQMLGVDNIQGEIKCNIAEQLPRLVWHLEKPKINSLQVSLLAQLTSKHVKVALSGLGGDELFYGYNAHKLMLKAAQANHWMPSIASHEIGSIGEKLAAITQKPVWSEPQRAMGMLKALGDWPKVYSLLRNVWDTPKLRKLIYGPRMLDSALPNAFAETESRWPDHPDPVTAMAQFEFRNKMVNDLLWQEDRVSMAEGLEVRVPFVDHLFAHQAQQLDRSTLMPGSQPKGYLKQTLAELLPAEIFQRPKSGFQVSSPDFYHQHLKPLANEYLSTERVNTIGLFNPAFIQHVLAQKPGKNLRWHYFILYFMLLTHLWIDLFEEGHGSRSFITTH